MPTFKYQPLSSNGAKSATIDAPDRAAAIRTLRDRGITPVSIEHAPDGALSAARSAIVADSTAAAPTPHGQPLPLSFSFTSAMSRAEMAAFIAELATAVQAGLTLVQAMKTIARQGRTSRQRAMLAFLIDQVEHGKSFSDAAALWGRPFTDLTVNLFRAGEASGKLGDVLHQAALLLEKDIKLRRSIVSAITYPAILAVFVTAAIAVVGTVIVPNILRPFAGMRKLSELPFPTRVVSFTADFFGAYWWLVLGLIAAAIVVWPRIYRQPATRLSIDRFALRVPVLGTLLRDVAVARFTRTLGTLISAGLPALTALRSTKATLNNKAMEVLIEQVCDQVAAGKTISEPLEQAGGGGVFPPLLVQIVSVGERSGRLPELLRQAADAMEARTEASIKAFTTILPPLLVVVAAGIVGFVVAAILLPLLEMQDYIS